MNDRHAPLDAPDDAVGTAHLGDDEAVIGDVREDAGVDLPGRVDDLLAVDDPPAHVLTAALERAFASTRDEADAELVPHDDGTADAGSEHPEASSDAGQQDDGEPGRQGETGQGDVESTDGSAHGLGVDDGVSGADAAGGGLGEPVGHGAGDGDDGW